MNGKFLTPLIIQKLARDRWRLKYPLLYRALDGTDYTVPEEFECDGASIPRLFWSLVGHPLGEYADAAFLHDWAVRFLPRPKADRLFEEAMVHGLGVDGLKAQLMYKAVHITTHLRGEGDEK